MKKRTFEVSPLSISFARFSDYVTGDISMILLLVLLYSVQLDAT